MGSITFSDQVKIATAMHGRKKGISFVVKRSCNELDYIFESTYHG